MDGLAVRAGVAPRRSVADVLLGHYPVEKESLLLAQVEAKTSGMRLELVLRQRGLVNDGQIAHAISEYLDIPVVSLAYFSPDEDLINSIPSALISRLRVLPIQRWGTTMAVAMADPFDALAIDELETATNSTVVAFVAPEGEVVDLLRRYQTRPEGALADVLRDVPDAEPEFGVGAAQDDENINVDEIMDMSGEDPVVRVVNSILVGAIHQGASDIHVEPMEKNLHVRYRIDGVLYDQPSPPKHLQWPIIARIKILSALDIAECRRPQDGRFTVRAYGKEVDIRVSTVRTVHGQKVVMRILDKTNLSPNLAALCMEKDVHEALAYAIQQPYGMILVTGPTGSGKTTTLYSALGELNKTDVNIVTIEDPVEYQLPRVNQIQVHPEIGATFVNGLRAVLRQDPDILMVGEIRDSETASIAVQAALTGHLVLSTLHTNDAAGAVTRLMHMGLEPFLIASSLLVAQAQRIYRKLCPMCKRNASVPAEVMRVHGIEAGLFEGVAVFGPGGCGQCSQIGYRGREAVMEVLPVDEEIRELILRRSSSGLIRKQASSRGMLTLREIGLLRVKKGRTSIQEILRVTR